MKRHTACLCKCVVRRLAGRHAGFYEPYEFDAIWFRERREGCRRRKGLLDCGSWLYSFASMGSLQLQALASLISLAGRIQKKRCKSNLVTLRRTNAMLLTPGCQTLHERLTVCDRDLGTRCFEGFRFFSFSTRI